MEIKNKRFTLRIFDGSWRNIFQLFFHIGDQNFYSGLHYHKMCDRLVKVDLFCALRTEVPPENPSSGWHTHNPSCNFWASFGKVCFECETCTYRTAKECLDILRKKKC